jgi:hypothetical protein
MCTCLSVCWAPFWRGRLSTVNLHVWITSIINWKHYLPFFTNKLPYWGGYSYRASPSVSLPWYMPCSTCVKTKHNLFLKTRPRQLLGSLLLAFCEGDSPYLCNEQRPGLELCLSFPWEEPVPLNPAGPLELLRSFCLKMSPREFFTCAEFHSGKWRQLK